MVEVRKVDITSDIAMKLHTLLLNEWPDLDTFEDEKYGNKIPCPVVAIDNNRLVGGLSFTSYKEPSSQKIVTWVNALFIVPEMRKQGIARALIQASQEHSACLYALTDVPGLYIRMGWQAVKIDCNGTIVKYAKKE